jgi:DNA-binding beta-propeller fold protein YncE
MSLDGAILARWTEATPASAGDGLMRPSDVARLPDGTFWVTNSHRNRLDHFSADGKLLGTFGENGTGPQGLNDPLGIVADADGNLVVADYGNNRVEKLGPDLTRRWVLGAGGGNGTAGTATGEFNGPYYVALDRAGDVLVADRGNNRIQMFDRDGRVIRAWGAADGRAAPGSAPGQLRFPHKVVVDDDGNVLVADTLNHRVQEFALDGRYLTSFGNATTMTEPKVLLALPGGRLLVTNYDTGVVELWGR